MTTDAHWVDNRPVKGLVSDKQRIAELEAEIVRLKEQLDKVVPDSQVVERTKT